MVNDSWCVSLQTAPCEHRARGARAVQGPDGSGGAPRLPQQVPAVLQSGFVLQFVHLLFFTRVSQCLLRIYCYFPGQLCPLLRWSLAWAQCGAPPACSHPSWLLFLKICILANAQKGFPWKTKVGGCYEMTPGFNVSRPGRGKRCRPSSGQQTPGR